MTELGRREQSFSVFLRSASDFFWNREHFLSRNLLSTGFYPVPLPWGCPQEAESSGEQDVGEEGHHGLGDHGELRQNPGF